MRFEDKLSKKLGLSESSEWGWASRGDEKPKGETPKSTDSKRVVTPPTRRRVFDILKKLVENGKIPADQAGTTEAYNFVFNLLYSNLKLKAAGRERIYRDSDDTFSDDLLRMQRGEATKD